MGNEREYTNINPKQMWLLLELLDLPKKCMYCGEKLKEGDKFSIFNHPDRVACNNILCVSKLVDDEGE